MNWDDLRYFLALSRAKTLSGAGKELGIKHTTVARRIQAFEQSIGSRLFERQSTGYVMTHAGERLLEHALVMEDKAQEVSRTMFGLDTQLQGRIRITGEHNVLSELVPYLSTFKQTYPKIELQLSSSIALADLTAREADIAVRLTLAPPDFLIGRKVLPLTLGLYASCEYLDNNPEVNHLILQNTQDKQSGWAKRHFPDAEVSVVVNEITVMTACANNHMGVALLPCYIADKFPDLRRLPHEIKQSSWGIWVLSHADLRETTKIRVCREFLIDIISKMKPLISGEQSRFYK